MKNNVLSAFVVFFAVVACLLIIDDLSHTMNSPDIESSDMQQNIEPSEVSSNLATLD